MYLEPKTMPALRPRPPEVEAGCSAFIQSLIDLLGDAEGALDGNRLAARALIRSALSILEAERARRGTAPAPLTGLSKGGLPPWHARRIKGHIEANLGDPILLEDLAAIVQVSVRHFCLAFKQSFGQSPHAYIVRQRIEKAQRLMLQTDDSLARIALDCGLADQAHLSKWFRRLTGVSPAVWRKEHRGWSQTALGGDGEALARARA
jgi:transcriptional regulator GlxA family with amidase domain